MIKSVEKEKCLHETKKNFLQKKNIFYIRPGKTKNLKNLKNYLSRRMKC